MRATALLLVCTINDTSDAQIRNTMAQVTTGGGWDISNQNCLGNLLHKGQAEDRVEIY